MQPRVENGNANPLLLCEPLRRTLISLRVRFSPSGWQVRNNSAFRGAVPLARSWPCLTVSDLLFFFFSSPRQDWWGIFCKWNHCNATSWGHFRPHAFYPHSSGSVSVTFKIYNTFLACLWYFLSFVATKARGLELLMQRMKSTWLYWCSHWYLLSRVHLTFHTLSVADVFSVTWNTIFGLGEVWRFGRVCRRQDKTQRVSSRNPIILST